MDASFHGGDQGAARIGEVKAGNAVNPAEGRGGVTCTACSVGCGGGDYVEVTTGHNIQAVCRVNLSANVVKVSPGCD